jgi:hypothetical protein
MKIVVIVVVAVIALFLLGMALSARIVKQYEQGVLFWTIQAPNGSW